MNNKSQCERKYPANSFTVDCGFNLHNKSSTHYENVRKNMPFVLIPDKRALLDVNKKTAISEDSIFSSEHIHLITMC